MDTLEFKVQADACTILDAVPKAFGTSSARHFVSTLQPDVMESSCPEFRSGLFEHQIGINLSSTLLSDSDCLPEVGKLENREMRLIILKE